MYQFLLYISESTASTDIAPPSEAPSHPSSYPVTLRTYCVQLALTELPESVAFNLQDRTLRYRLFAATVDAGLRNGGWFR